jgi:outer membrane lipoprotein-sorting protein
MVAVAIMTAMSVQAQIPAEVKDILEKCAEKNHHSGGYELDMKLHVGAVIASMNGTMKMCMKGEKSFSVIQMKVMGHEIYTETGFDGTQTWRYSKDADDEERDTLTITKGALKKKDKFAIDMGLDMKYKKAKLKTTDKHYEITFTEPLNKETPKKSIIRIDKNKYLLHEYETKVSIASVKMTVTRIKYGVSDNMFVLDPKKYPNAVVVRK